MVRTAAAVIRNLTDPTVSERSEIRCRFGRNRRFVLTLEWLTLCPTWTRLPVITHLRAILHLKPTSPHTDATRGPFQGRAQVVFYAFEPRSVKLGRPRRFG